MNSEWYLIVVAPEAEPFEWTLSQGETVLGRSKRSDLCIPDRFVSRRHSKVTWDGGGFVVEDLKSRNGTLLNGEVVQRKAPLHPGDVLRLSGTTLTVAERDWSESGLLSEEVAHEHVSTLDMLVAPGQSPFPRRSTAQRDRLQLLHDIHYAMGSSITQEELFELILDRIFNLLHPENAVIYLREDDKTFKDVAHRSTEKEPERPCLSRHLLREVVDAREAILVFDTAKDDRFAAADSLLRTGVGSFMATPMMVPDRVLGVIVVSTQAKLRKFSRDDLDLLLDLASLAALRVDNLLLSQHAVEHRKMAEELALARKIQEQLLPDRLPEIPGYQMHASNKPSHGVSGDLYSWHIREGGEVELLLADVSGKGMGAALLTASLEALVAGPLEVGHPPDEICRRLSRRLIARTPPEKFATVFIVRLQPRSGWLTYCSAGHNPSLVLRRGGEIDLLEPTGIPVGLFPDMPYETDTCELRPGDTLFVYTDGIVEAENSDGEEYGMDRLFEACRKSIDPTPDQLARSVGDHLLSFTGGVPFADDRTLLILRRDP